MGNTSTFGTFTVARLGIFVAQHALNTTGNNIANINTEGYTREKLDQSSMYFGGADRYQSKYDIRENGGVLANGVDQMRDQYLDIRYRNEMTKVGESDAKLDGLKQLDAILDEVAKGDDGEGVLEARFNDFIQQLQELSKDSNAGNDDIDALVRSSAEALAVQFNTYAKRLETLTENVTAQFKQELDATNTTLEKIRDLNETIRKTQIFGGTGLTLKDERNLLIDELSEKIGINVIYEMENLGDGVEVEKLKISTSGDPSRVLIDGIYGSQLSIVQVEKEVPKLDEHGNTVMENGKPVLEKRFVDNDNFDVAISELTDARGVPDPAKPNDVARYFETEYVLTDKSDAGYDQDQVWKSVKDQVKTLEFATEDDAKEYEKELNEQFGYQTLDERTAAAKSGEEVKLPYFHVSQNELLIRNKDGDLVNEKGEKVTDTNKATLVTYKTNEGKTKFVDAEGNELGDTDDVSKRVVLQDNRTSYILHFHDNVDATTKNDKEGKYSYANVEDARITRLGDTELRGGLQAMRELLTESGEYTTADRVELNNESSENYDPLHYDPDAGTKRGIPYYQKALDTLANVFAGLLNDANTLYGDSYIESLDPKVLYETDKNGKFVDADGKVLSVDGQNDPTKYVLKEEYKKYYLQNDEGEFLDANGNVLLNQNDPTQYVPNDRYIDKETLFKQDENGNFIDAYGNGTDTLGKEPAIDSFEAVSKGAATAFTSAEDALALANRLNTDAMYTASETQGKVYYYQVRSSDGKIGGEGSEPFVVARFELPLDGDGKITPPTGDDTTNFYAKVETHKDEVTDPRRYVLKDEFKKYFEFEKDDAGNPTDEPKRDKFGNLILKKAFKSLRGGALFSNSGNTDDTDGITAANISVSNSWAHGLNHVLRTKDGEAKKEDGTDNKSRAQDNIRHILTVMSEKHTFTTGNAESNTHFDGTFQQMLTDVIAGTLAKDESITQTMLNNYNTTADEIYVDRDAVMGVDLNDEAMNMMQYQKAYSAACRLMTTYDAMLEKLINGTAV